MMDNTAQQKVQKFEEFVDKRLKPDLVHAVAERDKVFAQQKVLYSLICCSFLESTFGILKFIFRWSLLPHCPSWVCSVNFNLTDGSRSSDLRKNIEALQNNEVASLRTLLNLGSEVYVQADIPCTRSIFVDIGLGFHVEFTWHEALEFIRIREARVASQVEEYTHLIASIKAQIKLVCEGIRELLQIPV